MSKFYVPFVRDLGLYRGFCPAKLRYTNEGKTLFVFSKPVYGLIALRRNTFGDEYVTLTQKNNRPILLRLSCLLCVVWVTPTSDQVKFFTDGAEFKTNHEMLFWLGSSTLAQGTCSWNIKFLVLSR